MYLKVAEWIHLETLKLAEIGRPHKTKSYKLLLNFNTLFSLRSRLGLGPPI